MKKAIFMLMILGVLSANGQEIPPGFAIDTIPHQGLLLGFFSQECSSIRNINDGFQELLYLVSRCDPNGQKKRHPIPWREMQTVVYFIETDPSAQLIELWRGHSFDGKFEMEAAMQLHSQNYFADKCLFGHDDQLNYITLWCDPTSWKLSNRATVFFYRTTLFHVSIETAIWSGDLSEWQKSQKDILERHKTEHDNCIAYFHIAHPLRGGQTQWNRVTKNMQKWWDKKGKKRFPYLCYSTDPWKSDYVIEWADFDYSVPYSYSVPITTSSYVIGNFNANTSSGYVQGNYSGYIYSTQMKTYQSSRNVWNFLLSVRKVEQSYTRDTLELRKPDFWSEHKGRWRWSKPDKNSFADALVFISRKLREKGKIP